MFRKGQLLRQGTGAIQQGRPTFGGYNPDGMNQRPQISGQMLNVGQDQGGMNPWGNIRPYVGGGQMNAMQRPQDGNLMQMLQSMYQRSPRRNFGNDLTSAGNALSKLWMGKGG